MNQEELKQILQFVSFAKHPTTEDIHRHLYSHLSRRSVERKLQKLMEQKMLSAHFLNDRMQQKSPRFYTLLLGGARVIGIEKLPASNYTISYARTSYLTRKAFTEFAIVASKKGWRLLKDEQECQQALLTFLQEVSYRRHGVWFPPHTIRPLLPSRIRPDMILQTHAEAIIIIIAHEKAESPYFYDKMEKYKQVIMDARSVIVTLTSEQQKICQGVIAERGCTGRYLVLTPERVGELAIRIP